MMAVTRGVGPESLKIRCSNEETSGMEIMVVFISFLIIAAIPPPRRFVNVCESCWGDLI